MVYLVTATPKVINVAGALIRGVSKSLNLEAWPRSVEAVTLNLSTKEVTKLRRAFELNTAKRYRNFTLVVDCATMIVNALKASTSVSIPMLIDPSPSSIMMYLSTLKTLGVENSLAEQLVENVFIVAPDAPDRVNIHILRNSYINIIEGKLLIYTYPFLAVHRAYLESFYGKDDFQYWDPEVKNVIAGWKDSVVEGFRKGEYSDQIAFFEKMSLELKTENEVSIYKERLAQLVGIMISGELDMMRAPKASFWSVMRSSYRIEYLKQWESHLEFRANGLGQGELHFHVEFESFIESTKSYL